ncbi:MAG: hypothetical protein COV30_01425 [Candidatus Yanofskybacteria bacterium CG10_big_fil_rev_8_21_14_0_10_37_15]|uniref:Uncharacterized protein n=1 Tax=Candidatus Yanofskybacteria bacterium CG10_big_fil_rev_8_21_14_0_10_37_15 TaxID=1975097 RepID=A0A2H0R726_9BACT|nr:MAG: hypothetical protein COV30_01425 [Candidatus Yanofskybacteria bacterium CG10_big_fil_rev_8_21_14_0_10_37_15]
MILSKKHFKKLLFSGVLLASFFIAVPGVLADSIGDVRNFFVNSKFDEFSRDAMSATLRHVSDRAYFYVDDRYWIGLNQFEKNILMTNILESAARFDNVIYLKETEFFGSEPNPGVDGDSKITILFESLKRGNGGYFETGNLYRKESVSRSNEREMFSVSADFVGDSGKIFLAHEFQHLISFNQKEVLKNTSDDIWMNELRSEYAITLVGYNDVFDGSNLDRRLEYFLSDPSDSLTEWPNNPLDYAHVAMFGEYIAEQFGPEIISETIRSNFNGIGSVDQYFRSKNIQENFSNVFGKWLAANYLNNVDFDSRFGYRREGLQKFRVSPKQYVLPYPGSYELEYDLKPWEGSWHQLNFYYFPPDKAIKIDFNSEIGFNLWYVDNEGNFGSLSDGAKILNKEGRLTSVVLIPVNESKITGFTENEALLRFSAKIDFVDAPILKNGDLIKRPHEKEIYVIEGKYKRYLRSEVIALYGHLDPANVIELDNDAFNSFITANYVRNIDQEMVYAIWPDGTKHWLNVTPQQWDASGRDWNAIFIINDLELNAYKNGPDITR